MSLKDDILPAELEYPPLAHIDFIEGAIQLASPDFHNKWLSRYKFIDIPEFIQLVKKIIDDWQRKREISDQNRLIFGEEEPEVHPDKRTLGVYTEYISWEIISRLPAEVSNGRRELFPRFRYEEEEDGNLVKRKLIMGQRFDNVVEFSCWAQTNKAVNARALWFQDLMTIYRWFFREAGVAECLFQGQVRDESQDKNIGPNTLKRRRSRYLVRTDRSFSLSEPVLRDLKIQVGVIA